MNNFWYALGDILDCDVIYDNIGNIFNYSCIVLGFFGLFYWLNFQKKSNDRAKREPNRIK